jgi:hypothetical protein
LTDQHENSPEPATERAEYEPPEVEDLDTSHGPSVTAALATNVGGGAAPRQL